MTHIPVIVRDMAHDEATIYMVDSNLKREKLTLDQAVACAGALSAPQEASGSREDFFAAFCQQPFQQVRNRFLSASPLPQPLERLRQLLKHPKEK